MKIYKLFHIFLKEHIFLLKRRVYIIALLDPSLRVAFR